MKKEQRITFDFNDNVVIRGNYNDVLCWPMFQLPVSVLACGKEGFHDQQFLLLKHQDQCLVGVTVTKFEH